MSDSSQRAPLRFPSWAEAHDCPRCADALGSAALQHRGEQNGTSWIPRNLHSNGRPVSQVSGSRPASRTRTKFQFWELVSQVTEDGSEKEETMSCKKPSPPLAPGDPGEGGGAPAAREHQGVLGLGQGQDAGAAPVP